MAARWAQVQKAALTSGGPTQDFTVGGETRVPIGLDLTVTHALVAGTAINHARYGRGFYDGTRVRSMGVRSENGSSGTDCSRTRSTTEIVKLPGPTANTIGAAATVAFITGGVRLTWTNFPSSALLVKVKLLFGEASCRTGNLATSGSQDVTQSKNVAMKPHHVDLVSNFRNNNNNVSHGAMCVGMAERGLRDEVTQGCFSMWEEDNEVTSQVAGTVDDRYCMRRTNVLQSGSPPSVVETPELLGAAEITAWNDNGFDITTREAGTSIPFIYFVVEYDSELAHDLTQEVSPGATGSQTYARGHRPHLASMLATFATAGQLRGLLNNIDNGSRFCTGDYTASDTSQGSAAYVVDANKSSPSQTKSIIDTDILHLSNAAASDAAEATVTGVTASDISINWTNLVGTQGRVFWLRTVSLDVELGVPLTTIGISALATTAEVEPVVGLVGIELPAVGTEATVEVSTPLSTAEVVTFTHEHVTQVEPPLVALEIVAVAPVVEVQPSTTLAPFEVTPLAPAVAVEVVSPLTVLETATLAPQAAVEVVAPVTVLELAPVAPNLVVEVEFGLTEMEIQPLAPSVQVQVEVTIPDEIELATLPVSVIVDMLMVVPMTIIEIETLGSILAGADMLTNSKRIYDAIAARIQAASFIRVSYDGATMTLVEGSSVTPTFELDETKSDFRRTPRRNRREFKQERGDWEWELVMKFHKAATTELFEAAWIRDPIRLAEDTMSGLEQVTLRLEDATRKHPPHQEASNGSEVTYRIIAELHPN